MRVFLILLSAIMVLAWLGYEARAKYKDVSNALFGFCALLTTMLVVALFVGLYE